MESAIYLLSQICSIPSTTRVLPAINSNFTHHISAGLADGTVITGQNNISHPSVPTSLPDDKNHAAQDLYAHELVEDANPPGSLPTLRKQNIEFSKSDEENLPARIERVWYINPYGHEIHPMANSKVIDAVQKASTIVYSIGSLYTSLVPSLILRGVGAAIANSGVKHKILILNSSVDRETGPEATPFTATDFVRALARAGAESQGELSGDTSSGLHEVWRYVTHVIHVDGEGAPKVDRSELSGLGVECIRVYGRRVDGMLRYDQAGLGRVLEALIGQAEMGRARRNTKV